MTAVLGICWYPMFDADFCRLLLLLFSSFKLLLVQGTRQKWGLLSEKEKLPETDHVRSGWNGLGFDSTHWFKRQDSQAMSCADQHEPTNDAISWSLYTHNHHCRRRHHQHHHHHHHRHHRHHHHCRRHHHHPSSTMLVAETNLYTDRIHMFAGEIIIHPFWWNPWLFEEDAWLPSGKLPVYYWKWPICSWSTMIYLLKVMIFQIYLSLPKDFFLKKKVFIHLSPKPPIFLSPSGRSSEIAAWQRSADVFFNK